MAGDPPRLQLTDTRSREKKEFKPVSDTVLLYVCGLTVSDDPHLGHARTWTSFDVLHRYLEYLGYDVRHVENVTDVDDKIIARAEDEDVEPEEVAARYTEQVYEDMKALGLHRVTVRPRVTEHVDDIIEIVETLVDRGYAYETEGGVYYDVSEFDSYGELSGQDPDELEQGEQREQKDDPADFALWKAAKPGEPQWDSPWGPGRPGWHVECSAMSTRHLGETIDIHGGGRDLVFPHHENEIAQTEAATGQEFARYWMHVGPLRVGEDKMSTSLDNYWTVHEALEDYSANDVRAFLISIRYSKPQQLEDDSLDEGRRRWKRLSNAVEAAERAMDSLDARAKHVDEDLRSKVESGVEEFEAAMSEDLNTPEALAALYGVVDSVNRHVESPPYDYEGLYRAWTSLRILAGDVLGFDFSDVGGDVERVVEAALEVRERRREEGRYDEADAIRDALDAGGVEVRDSDEGPTYDVE
ncbi:MAG: cysteine--tRNA ligase [Halobacteriota archaeon]